MEGFFAAAFFRGTRCKKGQKKQTKKKHGQNLERTPSNKTGEQKLGPSDPLGLKVERVEGKTAREVGKKRRKEGGREVNFTTPKANGPLKKRKLRRRIPFPKNPTSPRLRSANWGRGRP